MKRYFKYISIIIFTVFSFYYTDKVFELSKYNNSILASINEYSLAVNTECIEGIINENGIVLGLDGISVDENKSYSNMKGIGFRKDLIEFKKNKCILNKEDNKDKYIVSSNTIEKKISLVIDTDTMNYYEEMISIAKSENVELNILVNYNNADKLITKDNILYKTKINDIKKFKKKIKNFYCVKYYNFDVIDYCKKEGINSINIINYVYNNLLLNMKDSLSEGNIYFIKENYSNLKELSSTIKYIKSRGYNILSIDELLS